MEWTFPANRDGDSNDEDSIFGVYGSPAIGDDLVYVSAIDGVLYAIDRETGTINNKGWKQPRGQVDDERPPLVGEPALDPASNVVVVGSEDGNLYAYNARTGEPRAGFPFAAEDKIWSTPVIEDGVIYFGSHDKYIYAVSLSDGTLKWKFLTEGAVAGRPLLFRDMVIAGSFDKKLYAINTKDGRKVWDFLGDNWFWAGAVANGRTIFAPSMDGNIYALDRAGNLSWKYDFETPIVSRPVLIPAGLVVAGKNGKISLLDTSLANVGLQRIRSVRPLPDDPEILAPLAVVGESILVGAQDNTVRRIEIRASQEPMWCFDTDSENGRCN
jgi:outer membrane protein assembly factor BamB